MAKAKKSAKAADIRILVHQRGWVLVGRYSEKGDRCFLHGASVVRIWGTTKGLGEIAAGGPVAGKTTLDSCPEVEWHVLTGLFTIRCDSAKWAAHVREE